MVGMEGDRLMKYLGVRTDQALVGGMRERRQSITVWGLNNTVRVELWDNSGEEDESSGCTQGGCGPP